MPPLPVYPHFPALAVSDPPLDAGLPRCALRGSLDPITGIFYRAPEHHARMRTLQACDKCRVRKAKCSGDHPVCERCRIRGLTCQYAPERRARRWIKPASPDGELCSGDSLSVAIAPSPYRTTGADHRNLNGQAGEAVQPRRTTVPSPAKTTSTLPSSEGVIVALEQPIPHHAVAPKMFAASDDGSNRIPRACSSTQGMYTDDPCAALFQPTLPSSMTDGDPDHVVFVNHDQDPVYIDRGLTAAGCPERRVPHPVLFHPPLRPHQSGLGPGPPFPVDDQPPVCIDSPDRSHSACTSLTASPALTRPSSRGLPTPINSYPSSPFTLASLSPTIGPYACDPHAYPLFSTGEIPMMDQGQYGAWTDDVTWRETKDGACAWEDNAFLDIDSAF